MKIKYDNSALDAISNKFNEGINDITPVTAAITAGVLLIIILSVTVSIRSRRKILRSAEASYQSLLRKYNLTILEIDIIERLAVTLKKPQDKYHLLINKSSFRQALKKTEYISEDDEKIINRLKEKLRFMSTEETGIISTRILKSKTAVKIGKNTGYSDAEIYSTAENNITVKCLRRTEPLSPDEELLLFACISGKLTLFRLIPEKVKSELFSAPHVEAEKTFKLNIKLDILVENGSSDKRFSFKSKIVLLSEEGAIILDKENLLESAEHLLLYFSNDKDKAAGTAAIVIKTSTEKRLASIKFTGTAG